MEKNISDAPRVSLRSHRMDPLLLLLLLASLCLNVYLGWRIRRAPHLVPIEPSVKLAAGVTVAPLEATAINGRQQTISYNDSDKPTVLYVLSPSCIWCERNRKNIDELTTAKANDFRFVGLSLSDESIDNYAQEHHLNFPLYSHIKPEIIQALGLGGTPQTIVISPAGVVLKNWTGAYQQQTQQEVENYFHVKLPGLVSPAH